MTISATDGTGEPRWRLGNRNPRNLYLDEQHAGMLIDPELAELIVRVMNKHGGPTQPAGDDAASSDRLSGTHGHPKPSTTTQEASA